MRKSSLLLLALAVVPLAGLALPATAQSGVGSGASQPAAESIELGAIPVKPVAGHLSISGIAADDEGDDMPAVGNNPGESLGAISAEDEGGIGSEGEGHEAD